MGKPTAAAQATQPETVTVRLRGGGRYGFDYNEDWLRGNEDPDDIMSSAEYYEAIQASKDANSRDMPDLSPSMERPKIVRFEENNQPRIGSREQTAYRRRHDQVRVQPATLTQPEQPLSMRMESYSIPSSIYTHQTIPINAPPVEKILRPSSDSVTGMSIAAMTPTELRQMREELYELRNTVLQRVQRCPYIGCGQEFLLDANVAEEQQELQKHLAEVHTGRDKCNFCDDDLFHTMSADQRREHFVVKHQEDLSEVDHDRINNTVDYHSLHTVDTGRESRWNFCARCGRDHTILSVHADRTHHDNVCYPGVTFGWKDVSPCDKCGSPLRNDEAEDHVCAEEDIDDTSRPYCEKCALPLGWFTKAYREKHMVQCKGHEKDVDAFCPWCGVAQGAPLHGLEHEMKCARRPDDEKAHGPLNPDTEEPWPFLPPREESLLADIEEGLSDIEEGDEAALSEGNEEVVHHPGGDQEMHEAGVHPPLNPPEGSPDLGEPPAE
jgi:hypothetical protein